MTQASQATVVADHSTVRIHAPIKVCGFEAIRGLVTARLPPNAFHRSLGDAGVRLLASDGEQGDRSLAGRLTRPLARRSSAPRRGRGRA